NLEKSKLAKKDYENAFHLFPPDANGWRPKVKICSAIHTFGLKEIWEMILDFKGSTKANGFFDQNRSQQRLDWMHGHIRLLLEKAFYQQPYVAKKLKLTTPHVLKGEVSSISLAKQLVNDFLQTNKSIP